jgi:hypothetical protein
LTRKQGNYHDVSCDTDYPDTKAGIKGFYGINRKKKGSAGECVDCQNVDSDEFPCLRSVKGNKQVKNVEGTIGELVSPIGDNFELCGVIDKKLIVEGERKGIDGDDTRVDSVIRFFDSVVTVPNFEVYSIKKGDNFKRQSYRFYEHLENTYISFNDGNYRLKLDKSLAKNEYINKKITLNEKVVYLYVDNYEWNISDDDYFFVNFISQYDDTNVTYVDFSYYKKDETGKFVLSNNTKYENAVKKTFNFLMITEYDNMPVACGWYNRVWGCSEDGREIRCSKVGELNNFSDYAAGAASSWFCEVGSDGKFCGIIPYNDALFAFKENHVHVVYGTTPQNFSMEKTFTGCGCIDGRSITVSNNALYWLGYNGIYRYTGNSPKLISENLNKKYKSGIAFSDNRKVFFNLTDYEGNKELLSFDTEKGLWHKYSYIDFIGGFSHDGKLYAYTTTEVYEIYGEGYGEWSFEGVMDYNDTFDDTAVPRFYIRAELRSGSTLKFEFRGISESDWEECGSYVADTDSMMKEYFTPRMRRDMAYQYRISGTGEAYIYECEKEVPAIGRKHNY